MCYSLYKVLLDHLVSEALTLQYFLKFFEIGGRQGIQREYDLLIGTQTVSVDTWRFKPMSQARTILECQLLQINHEIQCALSGYTACIYREMAGEDCHELKDRYSQEHAEALAKREALNHLILDLDI